MKSVVFIGSLLATLFGSGVVLLAGFPPLLLLIGIALFFGLMAFFLSRPFYAPSALISILAIIFTVGAIIYPRILASEARTPSAHYQAAESLAADWRIPFQSESAAWPHWLSAAQGGVPQAECVVGMAYLYRHFGVPFDRVKAKYWLQAAAAQGNVDAQRQLGNVDTVPDP